MNEVMNPGSPVNETFTEHISAALGNELSEVHNAIGRSENLMSELHVCLSKIFSEYEPSPEMPDVNPDKKESGDLTFSRKLHNFKDEISGVKARADRLGD